ncbi:MAG: hypothetical protein CVU64_05800 [Deltaproteobacteria bacterium HGW-Deltaproteobacteria-21]|nr:MAG: hypothetical protein CVU64_05800 [Deltaproteobacteria bacterium HGW-Deltaproteobacteria-21]
MNSDTFGNLMEWGKVLQNLEELKQSGRLNEHQPGLVRILRYRHNWRLREAVLGCLDEVSGPCEELVKEVLHIAMDEGTYLEARILAIQALSCLLANFKGSCARDATEMRGSVVECMEDMLNSPQPLINRAARESCGRRSRGGPHLVRMTGDIMQ